MQLYISTRSQPLWVYRLFKRILVEIDHMHMHIIGLLRGKDDKTPT